MNLRSIYFSVLFSVIVLCSAHAQRKPNDPKHENWYSVANVETDDLLIEFSGSHSQQEFTTTKVKVTNKTNDYILWKTTESIFKYEFGEFKPAKGMLSDGNMLLGPGESDTKTLKVSGGNKFHVDNLKLILDGFYKIAFEGNAIDAPDFKLPPNVNDFKAGKFEVSLDKLKKETKETEAKFKVKYTGTNVGFLDPSRCVVKIPNGQEYATANRKDKKQILFPGDTENIKAVFQVPGKVVDMQFANLEILWKDTFREAKAVPFKVGTAEFVLDPGMTEGKNR
ncbi:MAG: hypothetical protein ACK40G_02040 [Cytophagaceae bacterium]